MAEKFEDLIQLANLTKKFQVSEWESSTKPEELTAELREEFAQRYEHDKGLIVEAVDGFIKERVEAEMIELAEDKQKVAEERVAYKKAVSEHSKKLEKFVAEQLAKEVKELRDERNAVSEHVSKLDDFVVEQLSGELKESPKTNKPSRAKSPKWLLKVKKHLQKPKKTLLNVPSTRSNNRKQYPNREC